MKNLPRYQITKNVTSVVAIIENYILTIFKKVCFDWVITAVILVCIKRNPLSESEDFCFIYSNIKDTKNKNHMVVFELTDLLVRIHLPRFLLFMSGGIPNI